MVRSKWIREAQVFYDEAAEFRWLDAAGVNVTKKILQPGLACDDTTGDPTGFVVTVTEAGLGGDSTIVNSATAGELLLLTTDNAEYDGLNVQVLGEAFKITTAQPFYFGIRAKVSDATQSDLLLGLCEIKTDLLKVAAAHGVTAAAVEGAFFLKVDGATTIAAKAYLDGVETVTANAASAEDTSYHIYEIYWDGTTLYWYLDGILVTSAAASLPDGDLSPSINFRAGAAAAKTMNIAWMRAIQIN